jgi:hypothetical protein
MIIAYRDKKVVGVFVHVYRNPLHLSIPKFFLYQPEQLWVHQNQLLKFVAHSNKWCLPHSTRQEPFPGKENNHS